MALFGLAGSCVRCMLNHPTLRSLWNCCGCDVSVGAVAVMMMVLGVLDHEDESRTHVNMNIVSVSIVVVYPVALQADVFVLLL